MVHDQNGKPRGYAFVEYSSKEDMHSKFLNDCGDFMREGSLLLNVEKR